MNPSIRCVAVSALTWLWCTAAVSGLARAQDSSASVVGDVRSADGHPLEGVFLYTLEGGRQANSDSQGRFEFRDLAPGTVHIRVRYIGYRPFVTTVTLAAGERQTLHLQLGGAPPAQARAQAESARAAAGGVDSVADGLVAPDTAASFGYERFGIELLRAALRGASREDSRVLSPLSAGQALAVLLGAARDSTAILLGRALDLDGLDAAGLAALSRRFNEASRERHDVILKVANALWVDTAETLQDAFARTARTQFAAVVRTLPLTKQVAVGAINHWADSVTAGLIPEVRRDTFPTGTEVVLTNAVYFKGQWLDAFDSALTRERPFASADGGQAPVPMMERTGSFAYRRGRGYQALRIPYRDGLSAMYVLLPDSELSAVALLDSIGTSWPLPDPRREAQAVNLRMPRLHLTQGTDLRPPLAALGLDIIFDSMRADFGGLVVPRRDLPPPCPPLSSGSGGGICTRHRVSSATQRVYLDVDEQGTKAAAVTTVAMEMEVTAYIEPPHFWVDRPFLFALRDERTGTFLFMGYVASPTR